jgi:hypothetical protein
MSIIIRNLGGDLLGVCNYEVRINERVICNFKHNRPDGLSKCLSEASRTVVQQQWLDAAKLLEAYGSAHEGDHSGF